MSPPNSEKKQSYSPVYKIYRRLRFIRYKRRLLKKNRLELRQKELQEKRDHLVQIKEFKLSEKQRRILKAKAEREESKQKKREIKEELQARNRIVQIELEKLSEKGKFPAVATPSDERKERIRLFWSNQKNKLKAFFSSLKRIDAETIRIKWSRIRDEAPRFRLFVLISFNSTVFFLLAYFSLFFISQLVTVITAGFFHYPTIVYYYEIFFNISSEAWYQESVKTIFSSGPLFDFVLGIICLIIYTNLHELTGPYKLFFLWGFLQGINLLFGALLVGTLFETGVGHVISWMYVMDTGKVLYSIMSVFLLFITGIVSTRQFLISGNSYYNEINKSNRTLFVFSQVLMPYFAGNAFLILLRLPRFVFYDTFVGVALIMCIIPVLISYKSFNELYFEEEEKKPRLALKALAVLAAMTIIFRVALEFGIHFGR